MVIRQASSEFLIEEACGGVRAGVRAARSYVAVLLVVLGGYLICTQPSYDTTATPRKEREEEVASEIPTHGLKLHTKKKHGGPNPSIT